MPFDTALLAPTASERDFDDKPTPFVRDVFATSADEVASDKDLEILTPQLAKSDDSFIFTPSIEHFKAIKNWEGVITAVEEDKFFASIRDTESDDEVAENEIEIDFDNVAEGDRDLICIGSVFYLTVGILRLQGQGPQKTTRLIFRRMPRWSSRDIERAESATDELWKMLQGGEYAKQANSVDSRD